MESGFLDIRKIDDDKYFVKNSKSSNYIKMGHEELEFLKCLKEYEVNKIAFNNDSFVYKDYTKEEIEYLIDYFSESNFIDSGWFKKDTSSSSAEFGKKAKSACRHDASSIHIASFNSEKVLHNIKPYTEKLFSRYTMAFSLLTLVISFFLIKINIQWVTSITLKDFSLKNFIILIIMFIITIIIHEFSHAVSCVHYGGKVPRMGIMLFYLAPAFYCDLSAIYFFERKTHKILVTAAGIISQIFLSSFAIIVYSILKIFNIDYKILILYAILNFISCIGNLIPFVKLDGYWMLSGILDVTNLREKSIKYIISVFKRAREDKIVEYDRNERLIFIIYGILSVLFSAIFWAAGIYAINSYIGMVFNNIVKNILLLSVVLFIIARSEVISYWTGRR